MSIVRASYNNSVIDGEGDAVSGAYIEVRQPGTTTKITETIYSDESGLDVLANPFQADAYGRYVMYLNKPKRVDLYIYSTGYISYTLPNVDITRTGESGASTLMVAANNALPSSKVKADYVCSGTADDVDIQAAIDELGSTGGTISLSEGTFNISTTLLMDSIVTLEGQGVGSTILYLSNGANCDVMRSRNFLTLTGTDSQLGERMVCVRNLMIDGNKANNTSGYGLRKYGYHWIVQNVVIKNCKQDGVWSEWGTYGGNPSGGSSMEDQWNNVKIHNCDGNGVDWRGPHDSIWHNVVIFYNTKSGMVLQDGVTFHGSPLTATDLHLWGNGATYPVLDLVSASLYAMNLEVSGANGVGGIGIKCGTGTYLFVERMLIYACTTGVDVLSNDHNINGEINTCTTGIKLGSGAVAVGGVKARLKMLGCTTFIDWANGGNQNMDLDIQAYVSGGETMIGTSTPALGNNSIRLQQSGAGTLYRFENSGAAANVTDGGTIAHGLGTTPAVVTVSPSVANEMVSVTGVDGTNITVAIKKHDGSAGTQQTIYWRAHV